MKSVNSSSLLTFCHTLDENYNPRTGDFKEIRLFHNNLNYRRYRNYSKLYRGIIWEEMKLRMRGLREDICYLYRNKMSGKLFDNKILFDCENLIAIMWELKIEISGRCFEIAKEMNLEKILENFKQTGNEDEFLREIADIDGAMVFMRRIASRFLIVDEINFKYYFLWYTAIYHRNKSISQEVISDLIKQKLIETNRLFPYWY